MVDKYLINVFTPKPQSPNAPITLGQLISLATEFRHTKFRGSRFIFVEMALDTPGNFNPRAI